MRHRDTEIDTLEQTLRVQYGKGLQGLSVDDDVTHNLVTFKNARKGVFVPPGDIIYQPGDIIFTQRLLRAHS